MNAINLQKPVICVLSVSSVRLLTCQNHSSRQPDDGEVPRPENWSRLILSERFQCPRRIKLWFSLHNFAFADGCSYPRFPFPITFVGATENPSWIKHNIDKTSSLCVYEVQTRASQKERWWRIRIPVCLLCADICYRYNIWCAHCLNQCVLKQGHRHI